MLLRLDTTSDESLFVQIAAQIRGAMARGEVVAGERLLPARELASVLGVNLHTVLRAYQQLVNEGLVEMRRGRGVTVVREASSAQLTDLAGQLVHAARRFGFSDDDIRNLLEVQL